MGIRIKTIKRDKDLRRKQRCPTIGRTEAKNSDREGNSKGAITADPRRSNFSLGQKELKIDPINPEEPSNLQDYNIGNRASPLNNPGRPKHHSAQCRQDSLARKSFLTDRKVGPVLRPGKKPTRSSPRRLAASLRASTRTVRSRVATAPRIKGVKSINPEVKARCCLQETIRACLEA